jgi:limonene-1,2-epoxide hydrolase
VTAGVLWRRRRCVFAILVALGISVSGWAMLGRRLSVHYTRLDSGEVVLPCCNVFRLRDGLIADFRSYMDATPVYS